MMNTTMRSKLLGALKNSGNRKLEGMFVNVIRQQKEKKAQK
jgi:hypothetical protein